MLTDLIELSHKIEENVKAMQSEINENIPETSSEGKETGTQKQWFGAELRKKHSTGTE